MAALLQLGTTLNIYNICAAIELLFLVGFAETQATVRPAGFSVTEIDRILSLTTVPLK